MLITVRKKIKDIAIIICNAIYSIYYMITLFGLILVVAILDLLYNITSLKYIRKMSNKLNWLSNEEIRNISICLIFITGICIWRGVGYALSGNQLSR